MTLNNYTPDELMHLRAVVAKADSKIKYITWNEEISENKTPHLQIYAQAFTKLSVKAWHSALGPRIANIVPTENLERALKYCQGYTWDNATSTYIHKEGSSEIFEEYGKSPEQGKRTDLESAAAEVRERPLKDILPDALTTIRF